MTSSMDIAAILGNLTSSDYFKWADKIPTSGDVDVSSLFSSNEAHPIALGMLLEKDIGSDWPEWEMQAIKDTVLDKYKKTISRQNVDKINALQTALNTTTAWEDWITFLTIIMALNGIEIDFEMFHFPTVEQMYLGADILALLDNRDYSSEIKHAVAAMARYYGVTYLPDQLSFAMEAATVPSYTCNVCGFTGVMDTPDQDCDICSGRFIGAHPFSYKADPEDALGSPAEPDVTYFLKYDPKEVAAKYEQVLTGFDNDILANLDESKDSDTQLMVLISALLYVSKKRKAMKEQLNAIERII